jgi:hypothetical protein
LDFGRNVEFIAFEIDQPYFKLVAAAPMPDGNFALVVPAGVFVKLYFEGPRRTNFIGQ